MIEIIGILFSLSLFIGGIYTQIAIFLSHLFVLFPLYITLKYNCRWLTVFLISSITVSLLWHSSKLWFYNIQFMQLDIVHQNMLIALSVALILFEHVPQIMLGALFSYSIFLSVFCLDSIDHINIYLFFSGGWIFALLIHIIYGFICRKIVLSYNLIMLLIYACISVLLYTFAWYNYNVIHSIWHVCAYSTLYFSFKISFCRERTDF